MGLFGKSDKEKKAEQEAHEQARRRMEEAKRARQREESRPAAPRTAAPAARAAAPAAPAAASEEYVVKSGDSLSAIAKRLLGDGNRWREIYEANRATIGDDPDRIQVGARLRIPR